ncbi:fluoride efflux transporter CrcB [Amaricoccus sp. W119]|uniref:fluoride efflux transporter CrcB n=1 Tax=Amaricoccus sp. W119 TaxID=3391833 RepID=UPI0039A59DA7
MGNFLIVAVGAGFGGAMRHGVNLLAARMLGTGFPFGTLAVNVLGSFLMGLLTQVFLARPEITQEWRLLITTGVLGGFTTFSTFSLDAAVLMERGAIATAAGYVILSVLASIGGLFLGLRVGG